MQTGTPLTEVIDSGARLVKRVGTGPLTALVLAGLPWRFGLAALASRVVEVGDSASQYGPYWRDWSRELLPLFALALLGRIAFTHACHQHLRQGVTSWRSLVPEPLTVMIVLYLAFAVEILLFATAFTVLGWAIFASLQGWILAAQPAFDRASPIAPWQALGRGRQELAQIAGLDLVFALAWFVALLNLVVLTQMMPSILGALPGFNPGPLHALVSLSNHRLWFGIMVGASLVVEPFRLAALSTLFFSAHSKSSGADLRVRLADLVAGSAT